jgi:hypothetical protein
MAGVLGIANGGTGTTTQAGALNALLPAQTGQGGKFLQTNGSTVSWAAETGSGTVTNVTGTLPITVATGTTTPVIAINAATTAATGSVQLATAAEAITGTNALKALTPATGVPKNAATMTGAALIPGGNDAARPTPTPVTGMLRYNNQAGTPAVMEFYDGAAWSGVGTPPGGRLWAWVAYNGVTSSIRASSNCSSVTVVATAAYRLNFATNAPSADYFMTGSLSANGFSTASQLYYVNSNITTGAIIAPTVTGFNFSTIQVGNISGPTLPWTTAAAFTT